ncbi:unnamed protein product, partial [marine sediment metagenome]
GELQADQYSLRKFLIELFEGKRSVPISSILTSNERQYQEELHKNLLEVLKGKRTLKIEKSSSPS